MLNQHNMKNFIKNLLLVIIPLLFISSATYGITLINNFQGGTGKDTSAWTGYVYITNGVWGTSTPAGSGDMTQAVYDINTDNLIDIGAGGTGKDWSAIATGSIPYFTGTGVMGTLASGTSTYVLTAGGVGVAPTWTAAGSGSVTSVDMSVPTGLTIGGNPITTSGTLALSLTAGYEIPTTASTTSWTTAYGWGDWSGEGFIALTDLSSTATGLTYTNTTGVFSLTAGYEIPSTASTSAWTTAYGWGDWSGQGFIDNTVATLSSLTSIGTIGTGIWQGTPIANAYIASSTEFLIDTDTTYTGGDFLTLTGTDFDVDATTTIANGDTANLVSADVIYDFVIGLGYGTGDVLSVGDCSGGACLDGSSDGGTYLDFYDAQGTVRLITGDVSAGITITLPTATSTLIYSGGAFHDGFSDFVANEHIDWTSDQGATNIHSGNYTDTNTFASLEINGSAESTNAITLDFDGTTFSIVEDPTDSFDININKGNLTEATSSVLTITGGTSALLSAATIEVDTDLHNWTWTNVVDADITDTLTCSVVSDADKGDVVISSGAWTLDTDSVADNEIDYANVTLSDFDYETAWRLFYSNTDGDMTDLAFGTSTYVLTSNGAAAAPTWTAAGNVTKVGTPENSQIGVWTGDGTIEGAASLTYDGSNLQLTGDIGSTGARITKAWLTDLTVTNGISGALYGNASTSSALLANPTDCGANEFATTIAANGNLTCASVTVTGTILTGVWNGTAVGTQWGGTGQNWASVATGSIPYFSATGVMGTLASGTSTWVLTAQGDGVAPAWAAQAGGGDVTAVGDCATGLCFDGTSDGGTYLDFYDAQGSTRLITGDVGAGITITLPTATSTLAGTNVATLSSLTSIGTIATGVWEGTDVGVAHGGTGVSAFTQYLLMYADTTTSFGQIAIGTAGQVLTSGGAGVAPAFETLAIAAGEYAAASIDGDDVNSNIAGRSLTLTGASPDTLDADAELYTGMITFSVQNATSTQNPATCHKFATAVTVTRISCATNNATSSIQFDERVETTPFTSGTDVLSAALTCSTTTASSTAFANATIAADAPFCMDIDAMNGNATTSIFAHIDYTKDD